MLGDQDRSCPHLRGGDPGSRRGPLAVLPLRCYRPHDVAYRSPGFKPLIRAMGQGRSRSRLGPILGPLEMKGSSPDAIYSHLPQSLMGKQGRLKGAGGGINPAKKLSRSLAGAEQTIRIHITK